MHELDYSYAEGMNMHDEIVTGEQPGEITAVHIAPEKLVINDADPDTAAHLARVHEAVTTPTLHTVELADGRTVNVEYTTLNGDINTKKVMAMFVGWGGSFQNPVGEREYGAVAATFPDTHVIAINFPGSEGSTNLPPDIARAMAKSGSFEPVAAILAPVVEKLFEKYEHKTLAGASLGARAAIAIAARLEKGIDVLRVVEPVGTRELGFVGIMKAFMGREPKHAAQIVANSPDPHSRELQIHNDSLGNLVKSQFRAALRGSWYSLMVRLPKAMSRDRLEDDLLATEGKVHQELTVISAEQSELNDTSKTRRILGKLALRRASSGKGPGIIRHRVMDGRPHSYLIGVPVAQAEALSAL